MDANRSYARRRRLLVESLEARWLLNGAPMASDDAFSVGQHAILVQSAPGVLANDTDPDGDPLQVISSDTSSTLGLVAVNKNGSFAYDPFGVFDYLEPGDSATDVFSYTISDGQGGTDTATVTITIVSTNAPLAEDDHYSTDEDAPLDISAPGMLANDTDPDGGLLEVIFVDTQDTLGQVAWNADGSFQYHPNDQFESLGVGETATDTFTYTVSDELGGMDTATVIITIDGVNNLPVAVNDTYATNNDLPLPVTVNVGLLANDTDPDMNDVLTVSSVDTSGTLGQVTWNTDGSFSYDPNGQFAGLGVGETATDTFTYTVSDGHGGSDTASATITIHNVQIGPVAADDAYETDEVTPLLVTADLGLLANDTHPDANAVLTVVSVDMSGMLGHVTWNEDGSFEYDTFGWFADLPPGATDTEEFTYTVSDELDRSATARVVITIIGVNDPPMAFDDAYTTDEATILTVAVPGLLANDFDVDAGDVLSLSSVDTSGTLGTVTWAADGSFEYDPNGKFDHLGNGEFAVDTFTYTVTDRHGGTDIATVAITVFGSGPIVNEDPVAGDDEFAVEEDALLTVATPGVLANDVDPDGNQLQVISVDTSTTLGLVNWSPSGGFTYNPQAQFTSLGQGETATDTFVYTISDGRGGTDTATVTITIQGVNEAPIAVDEQYETAKDTTLSVTHPGLLANDTDPNGDSFEVTGVDTTGTRGIVSWSANGSFEYDPSGQFDALLEGETAIDVFTYAIADVHGDTDTATVTITVRGFNNPNNRPPIATDDAYETDQDSTLFIVAPGLLGNDSDPDGDQLRLLSINNSGTLGLVAFQANGSFGYNPFGKFNDLGPGQTATDSFSYTVGDGQGGTDTATVTIVVSGGPGNGNRSPVAGDDAYGTLEDSLLTVAAPGVLANDTDDDPDDVLQVFAVDTTGTAGNVTWDSNGSFQYDPAGSFDHLTAGETATDTFTYTVHDGQGGSDTASVTITITGVNNPPVAVADAYTTDKSLNLLIPAPGLLANDTDVDQGDVLTVTEVNTSGTIGLVAFLSNGSFGYDPFGRFDSLQTGATASDTFTYTVRDSHGAAATATVTITITNAGDGPPALTIGDASAVEGNGAPVSLRFTVSLSPAASEVVRVNYATANGSATSGSDYQAVNGTLVFEPGVTTQTIVVQVIGDTIDEFDETFDVILSQPFNAVIGHEQGEGTIIDDDEPPVISISDRSAVEGDQGLTDAIFLVSLSGASGKVVTVSYTTMDGTATAAEDYQAVSGILTFDPGVTTRQIAVPVGGDTKFETDETFTVLLSNASNASIAVASGTGTILNDDDRPTISIAHAEIPEGDEGTSGLVFLVSLSHASFETISVDFTAADGTATAADGDYRPTSGSLVFLPGGELVQPVTVVVFGDTIEEDDETLFVTLSNALQATVIAAQAIGTIRDDDAALGGLSGAVYLDVNNNGVRDDSEWGVPGVTVQLRGVDDRSQQVDRSAVTEDGGHYVFENLRVGTYELIKTPQATFLDGQESSGTLGGHVGDDRIWGIAVGRNEVGTDNNFGELGLRPEYITVDLFFASTYRNPPSVPQLMATIERRAASAAAAAPRPASSGAGMATPPAGAVEVTGFVSGDDAAAESSAVSGGSAEGESVSLATTSVRELSVPLDSRHTRWGFSPASAADDAVNSLFDDNDATDTLLRYDPWGASPSRIDDSRIGFEQASLLDELFDDAWVRDSALRGDGDVAAAKSLIDMLVEREEFGAGS